MTNIDHTQNRAPERPQPADTPAENCPCGSGLLFGDCCAPIISRRCEARTAEELARARHTAHALNKVLFLMAIQEPTEENTVDWDMYQADLDTMEWLRFAILSCSTTENTATITSSVTCKKQGSIYRYQEEGRYTRQNEHWYFTGGEITALKKICPCDKGHCLGCF